MVHLVILTIQIESMKILVSEDSTVDYSTYQGRPNETNENSGLHNLVSCQGPVWPSDAHDFLAGRAKTTFQYDFMFLRISLGIYF